MKTSIKTLFATIIIMSCQLITVNCLGQANEPGSGNALDFDGTDDYINISNTPSLNFGTGDFTIEFWVRTDPVNSNSSEAVISNRNDACGDGQFWWFVMQPDSILFGVNNVSPTPDFTLWAPSVNDGKWHHIVGVRSQTEMNLYKDGVLIETLSTTPTDVNNAGATKIGVNDCSGFWPGGGHYSGQIDEIRTWNRALTQTEIRENMTRKLTGNEAGLVGYWRMDEGSGNTAFDSSPNGNDGTLN